jgi:hypothetical protein
MTPSKPPALATWMLDHFVLGGDNEALAGDLLEEFKHCRSTGWYWRQVFAAILVGFSKELRCQWQAAGFALIWTIVADMALRYLYHNPQYRTLLGWAIKHDWPESSFYFTGLELAPQFLIVWTGLSLYLAMMHRFSVQRFVRGVLICSFFCLLDFGFDLICPSYRGTQSLFVSVRFWMPPFVALLLSLCAMLPSSAMRRSTTIPNSIIQS